MKKLILSLMAAGFAVAAQAGSDKASAGATSCCAPATAQTKTECPMGKQANGCCAMGKTAKTACTRPILKSPKALG